MRGPQSNQPLSEIHIGIAKVLTKELKWNVTKTGGQCIHEAMRETLDWGGGVTNRKDTAK